MVESMKFWFAGELVKILIPVAIIAFFGGAWGVICAADWISIKMLNQKRKKDLYKSSLKPNK